MSVSGQPLVLVVNCGSSSIKYQLIDPGQGQWFLKGLVENIGADSVHHVTVRQAASPDQRKTRSQLTCADVDAALQAMADTLLTQPLAFSVIVHRVVHGGERYREPLKLTPDVIADLQALDALAPLHNPANRKGIDACTRIFPDTVQYAVFDTAYHSTLPAHAARYAIPQAWHAAGARRYGFHGTSHRHVAGLAARWLGKPLSQSHLISLHLGNGASITAIENGCSVDTSMGLTPLEGLIMGTRSGDIDSGIVPFVARQLGLSLAEVEHKLWHDSGLRALAGTNDMRKLLQLSDEGDAEAALAIEMYCYRIRKYIGAYLAALERTDAILFTGGVGENAAPIRQRILEKLTQFGIVLDNDANARESGPCGCISAPQSRIPVLVIATNEELEMALQVSALG
jgi:acetate kinase